MANINRIINVALLPEGRAVATDNMNVICIMTSETGNGVLSSKNRYQVYSSSAAVDADFGTNSKTAAFARTVFGTKPNATDFGGALVVGFYRKEPEAIPATAGVLMGAPITDWEALQLIEDGEFQIAIDGEAPQNVTIDGTGFATLADYVSAINGAITGATVELNTNQQIIITSQTTGAASSVQFAEAGGGTDISTLLGLAEGTGATSVDGEDDGVANPESQLQALTAVKAQVNIKGACFIDNIADPNVSGIAAWSVANSVLVYEVFSGNKYLNLDNNNPAWTVKLAGQSNFRCLYSKAGNRAMAASYMARLHTVNFNAQNSAMTMQLKELAVPAEEYSETELDKAQAVGLDVYTTFKNEPAVVSSGANDFPDNVYNLAAFVDHVQVGLFNLLKLTPTKIPQTIEGGLQIVDTAEKVSRRFVRAGVFAPGAWSNPAYFGDRETFERAIEQSGFYWMIGSFAEQDQADRQARKSPVLQGAVKNAGAIHSVSAIINFNY